jgi:hypothetical protein
MSKMKHVLSGSRTCFEIYLMPELAYTVDTNV